MRLDLSRYSRVVVLTGAGISVASGLAPFRGPGGLWEEQDLERVSSAEALDRDPVAVWRAFLPLRAGSLRAEPNPAHRALAEAERRHAGRFTVITQNVDGLHQKAGSRNLVEMHGNIRRSRCACPACRLQPFEDPTVDTGCLPSCPLCGGPLRLDIVLFGEMLDPDVVRRLDEATRRVDLFLAVGTSGVVFPAAGLAAVARREGAHTVLVNLEPHDPPDRSFDDQVHGRAEEVLPEILGVEPGG